jgi:hypothetical protein
MASSYFNLGSSGSAAAAAFADALVTKYGTGATVHYESTADLVFSCAAVCDHVLRVNFGVNVGMQVWFGDSWTSGTTMVNPLLFTEENGTVLARHAILGDAFILLTAVTNLLTITAVIGELSDGQFLAMGLSSSLTSTYYTSTKIYVTTNEQQVYPIGMEKASKTSAGKLIRKPLHFVDATTGKYVENLDGTPVYLVGDVWNISWSAGFLVGQNFLMTPSVNYCWDGTISLRTSMFAEFTP